MKKGKQYELLLRVKLHFLSKWNDKRGFAVVTHGGSLPDSSQKTDFYSIIDNATVTSIVSADISSSAGIMDSQLNTISTSGKVNTSALTGQIANANLAQIVTPALVSGAALTLLPNIPSGAGLIPAANIGGLIGSPVSKTIAQIYQALTDGIVEFWGNSSGNSQVNGFTDSSSTPTTQVSAIYIINGDSGGITFLVKKNNYYEVTAPAATFNSSALVFIPLGS